MEPRWLLALGALLAAAAFLRTSLDRLPLSAAMIYLAAGIALGPAGVNWIAIDWVADAPTIEVVAEIAVLVSLFAVGLKMPRSLSDVNWRAPITLATVGMLVTIAASAVFAHFALGLSIGLAVLLSAILAPTDPVLASDVQIRSPTDRDRLRFTLSGEGALNDGAAFPFVWLGLAMLGAHDPGPHFRDWFLRDVLWATTTGLLVGAVAGRLASELLRRVRRDGGVVLDEFLLLAIVALAYGAAIAIHAYGFLAVFAAGFTLRHLSPMPASPSAGGASLGTLLRVNEQLERLIELMVVVLMGVLISSGAISWRGALMGAGLLFVVRPLAVAACLLPERWPRSQVLLAMWFGVRGIGSLYYIAFAATHGLDPSATRELTEIVITAVALSIVVHGISGTRLMEWAGSATRGSAKPAHDSARRGLRRNGTGSGS
jgi:NhaP-type Na+/H+ or K+/H+ antiporter